MPHCRRGSRAPAPREPALSVPLAPSRLEAYAPDEDGEPLIVQPSRQTRRRRRAAGAAAGRADERQSLPARNADARAAAASADASAAGWDKPAAGFLARGAAALAKVHGRIAKETLAILRAPEFAPLFGPQSRAEVPIVALIPNPKARAPPLKLMGQIDRLVDLAMRC